MAVPLAWQAYRRWGAAGGAGMLAGSVLIDADHLVDYAWTRWRGERNHFIAPLHGWEVALALSALAIWALAPASVHFLSGSGGEAANSSRRKATAAGTRARESRRHLGAAPPGTPSGRRGRPSRAIFGALVAGAAAGWWLHLVQDLLTNRPQHAGAYSLVYRLWHRFRREPAGWSTHTSFHQWSGEPWYRWF